MLGPARSVHGGVSAVVNNFYKAGLDKRVKLTYLPTMVDGSKVRKLLQAILAYMKFWFLLPFADILQFWSKRLTSDGIVISPSTVIPVRI